MKESRIRLALQKKLTCKQNESKVKRVRQAIELAKANAEDKLAQAEDKLDQLVNDFTVKSDTQQFIQGISDALYDMDQARSTLTQLDRVHDYLFEELNSSEE